jgi:enoyl-CoA hydratase
VIPDLGTPLIGAVNGAAVAAGLELALACDFIVASELARFADRHAMWGVVPRWGLTVALPEAVGMRRAREMSATGTFISARTALEWGLVNHVVAHGDLLDHSVRLATDVASSDPEALEVIYATYDEGSQLTSAEALQVEEIAHAMWHVEGVEGADPENAA